MKRQKYHAVLAADHDQAAGGYILCTVLRRKGRIEGGVFLFPVETAALIGIVIQQLAHNGVFAAGLAEVVDRHILIKALHQLSGAVAQSIHLGGRDRTRCAFDGIAPASRLTSTASTIAAARMAVEYSPLRNTLPFAEEVSLNFFISLSSLSVPAAFFQS